MPLTKFIEDVKTKTLIHNITHVPEKKHFILNATTKGNIILPNDIYAWHKVILSNYRLLELRIKGMIDMESLLTYRSERLMLGRLMAYLEERNIK